VTRSAQCAAAFVSIIIINNNNIRIQLVYSRISCRLHVCALMRTADGRRPAHCVARCRYKYTSRFCILPAAELTNSENTCWELFLLRLRDEQNIYLLTAGNTQAGSGKRKAGIHGIPFSASQWKIVTAWIVDQQPSQ